MTKLIEKEMKLAETVEYLKEKLHKCVDFDMSALYHQIDDCNMRFIDATAMKRFLLKCQLGGGKIKESLIGSIIRRYDLDADAKLSYQEFTDGVKPIEVYDKKSFEKLERNFDISRASVRVKTGTKKHK